MGQFKAISQRLRIALVLTILVGALISAIPAAYSLPKLDSALSLPPSYICSSYISSNKTFIANYQTIYTGLICSPTAFLSLYRITPSGAHRFVTNATKVNSTLPRIVKYKMGDTYYYECRSCKDISSNSQPSIAAPVRLNLSTGENISFNPTCSDPDGDLVFLSVMETPVANALSLNTAYTGIPLRIKSERELNLSEGNFTLVSERPGALELTINCYDEFGYSSQKNITIIISQPNRPPRITDLTLS